LLQNLAYAGGGVHWREKVWRAAAKCDNIDNRIGFNIFVPGF
jgi:hypothetical protein